MALLSTTLKLSIAAGFLLIGFTSGVWGQVPPTGGTGSVGGELEGALSITGKVVCVQCTLEEVRKTQPELSDLYQLRHDQGQVVMQVKTVNNAFRWETIAGLSHQVPVRAEARVWQALTAEENLFKEVEIGGMLSKTRTLDIGEVTIADTTISALEAGAGKQA